MCSIPKYASYIVGVLVHATTDNAISYELQVFPTSWSLNTWAELLNRADRLIAICAGISRH